MEHVKTRYFETRDGRCLPFHQTGSSGSFCIFLNPSIFDNEGGLCPESSANLLLGQDCQLFIPNIWDKNEVCSKTVQFLSKAEVSREFGPEERLEKQAKDILDLADIFGMEQFHLIDGGAIYNWISEHYPNRLDQTVVRETRTAGRHTEESEVALAN